MLKGATCTFCGRSIPVGTGIMYVKNDGSLLYFCSSKCKKNVVKLRRNPTKVKWVGKTRRMYK
ncbi:MAG: 50S ribosomal protein L24e [Candidatus Nezhaarchaeota archaeon]|nr:50S ribosomal protein L24e [Candidatus Nezhaarchaeota archaeon]MCX8141799.1 50S ribosomal protein L24e [Candidatus Nezhaarchaeota archaeon]MDW8050422.1 50S ribosomal protein L24e [Nitrososphaerota archaeon]